MFVYPTQTQNTSQIPSNNKESTQKTQTIENKIFNSSRPWAVTTQVPLTYLTPISLPKAGTSHHDKKKKKNHQLF